MSRGGDDECPPRGSERSTKGPSGESTDSRPESDPSPAESDHSRPESDSFPTEPDDGTESLREKFGRSDASRDLTGAERLSVVPLTLPQVVVAITVAALAVRLVGLGARPMHFDEARVGYWSLHYLDTGSFAYRPIVHGPFVQIVNARLFELFGPSDFLARLVPAVVAGLFPATAYLYREHLRDTEVIALALFLAFNAIFVYYSRYLRSDMLLVAFVFTGFGLLVRYYDTRRIRYLYGVALFVALGLTTKENALVYVLTWVGATVLLVDYALFPPRGFSTGIDRIKQSRAGQLLGDAKVVSLVPFRGIEVAQKRFEDPLAVRRKVAILAFHTGAAALLGFLVLVFFYADRGAGMAGLQTPPIPASQGSTGLYEALGQPLQFPGYAYDTVAGAFDQAIDQWGKVDGDEDRGFLEVYMEAFNEELDNITTYAPGLAAFAVIGFLYERYATERPRALVMFMSYCAGASLLGYSLQNDPGTGYWLTIHILLPTTIPAAVGLSRFYRWGRGALYDSDSNADIVVVFVLVLVASNAAFATVTTSYVDTTSEENGLVQFAQPEAEASEAFAAVSAISGSENPDAVVYLGSNYSEQNHSGRYAYLGPNSTRYRKPTCLGGGWISSLPLPWYFGKADTNVSCERNATALAEQVENDTPPIVITKPEDESVPRAVLDEEYTARTFEFYRGAHPVTFHVHKEYVDQAPGWESDAGSG